ncbi:MAG: LacI family transcriptional regulator [Clostridiales Family XIII bacterium]|jgi:LacI family sucrose operon transcriptional repressor|nr:LacI family transcriptional regulator [Clostridiales Family XIII bacterium]
MATIRDVAKHAGVAISTVSRVLNDSGYVSEETREKIEYAMKELNYVPNELARNMFRKKSGIIAMIISDIKHTYFAALASYMEKELQARGYKLMLCSTDDKLEIEKEYFNFFRTNIIDGVISAVCGLDEQVYIEFVEKGKPIIMLDHALEGIPVVISDNIQFGEIAAEVFIKNNCKNVLQITAENHEVLALTEMRFDVLREILEDEGIKTTLRRVDWNNFGYDEYYQLATELLQADGHPDGIMTAEVGATAFLNAAIKLGVKVPEEFAIVAMDGTFASKMSIISMTTIVQDMSEIARRSVEAIMQMLDGRKPETLATYIPVTLREGETA